MRRDAESRRGATGCGESTGMMREFDVDVQRRMRTELSVELHTSAAAAGDRVAE